MTLVPSSTGIDYVVSDKQRLSGKWYWNHRLQDSYDWGHATTLAGYKSNGLVRSNKGGSGDYLYTFNPNNVLDVGLSLTRYGEGDEKPIMTSTRPRMWACRHISMHCPTGMTTFRR